MGRGVWKYRCGVETRDLWVWIIEWSFMGIDFRVFYFEGITGNIRLKELAKGERVEGKGRRPKTTCWETLESGCGKKTKCQRSRRTRAELCPGSCRRGGFSQEMKDQH